VVIKMVLGSWQASGATEHRYALPATVRIGPRKRRLGQVKINIASHEEIQEPVLVIVDKRAAGAPVARGPSEPGLQRNIVEFALTAVSVEHIGAAIIGDEQVGVTIIVEVARTHTLAPSGMIQSGLNRHVEEFTASVVLVKMIRGLLARGEVLKPGSVHEEDVEMIIAIIVQQSNPAA